MLKGLISQYEHLVNMPHKNTSKIEKLRRYIDQQSLPYEKDQNLLNIRTKLQDFFESDHVVFSGFRLFLDLDGKTYFAYSITLDHLLDRYSKTRTGRVFVSLVTKDFVKKYWSCSMKFVYPTNGHKTLILNDSIKPIIASIIEKGFSINTKSLDYVDPQYYIQATSTVRDCTIVDLKRGTPKVTVDSIRKRLSDGRTSKLLDYKGSFSIIIQNSKQ